MQLRVAGQFIRWNQAGDGQGIDQTNRKGKNMQIKRFFIYKSPGNITWGINRKFRCFIDWRDAADGITWIRPTIHFHRWVKFDVMGTIDPDYAESFER